MLKSAFSNQSQSMMLWSLVFATGRNEFRKFTGLSHSPLGQNLLTNQFISSSNTTPLLYGLRLFTVVSSHHGELTWLLICATSMSTHYFRLHNWQRTVICSPKKNHSFIDQHGTLIFTVFIWQHPKHSTGSLFFQRLFLYTPTPHPNQLINTLGTGQYSTSFLQH